MDKDEIRRLLWKYVGAEISKEEKEKFFTLFSTAENEKTLKEILLSLLENSEDEEVPEENKPDFDRIYKNILADIGFSLEGYKKDFREYRIRYRVRRAIMITGIAASLAGAFFLGSWIMSISDHKAIEKFSVKYLTEVRAPFGSNSVVTLPDGSSIMLNAGSAIKYQNDFNISNRTLTLSGEAYFRVARNPDLPFIVNAGDLNIRAVGTEFNVKAYDDENVIETTLVKGKIEITTGGDGNDEGESLNLDPNQKAIFTKETQSFTLSDAKTEDKPVTVEPRSIIDNIVIAPKINAVEETAWTNGKLVIKGEFLVDLCIKLQRKYNVTFVFMNEGIKEYRFSGILLDETLEQVLDAIKLAAPIKYSLSGRYVYLEADMSKIDKFKQVLK